MVAIVSHDAGGAEILSSWILRQEEPFCLSLDGPAKIIFKRKLGDITNLSLEDAVLKSDWVLCGTSWQSDLERRAIRLAKENQKKVVAFLDHWINYPERFQNGETSLLPDEIWTGDEEAKTRAEGIFNGTPVVLQVNPYFEDMRLAFAKMPLRRSSDGENISILYVCEPIGEHALMQHGDEKYWGYTEHEALNYFLDNVNIFNGRVIEIKIRPHPSERKDKYDWAASSMVTIGNSKPLLDEIAAADIIIGGESMAMVIGLIAGKRIISCIPPGGINCRLPQKNIEHFEKLISNQNSQINAQ
jgi:hypothetical protein